MKTCWGLSLPKVSVVYVYPVAGGIYNHNAIRFVDSYLKNNAGYDHNLCIIPNGGIMGVEMVKLFSLVKHQVYVHDNSGWDIGAFQESSRRFKCDLMLFLGSSAYFTTPGWLERMVEASMKHGFGLYGSTASLADLGVGVHSHIRTTGFWCNPELMSSYPFRVVNGGQTQRYEFEHGKNNFTKWASLCGAKVLMVTWRGEYTEDQWAFAPEAYHNGKQSALLVRDRITDPPFWPPKK